jgi:hypothetical protein
MWAEIFPRYGKFILRFSMLWKNNFHGVEKMGLPALVSIQFFHSMEKSSAAALAKPRWLVRLRRPL